jgi:hypothetical protein
MNSGDKHLGQVKSLEKHRVSEIVIFKGKSNVDLTGLADLLIENSSNRWSPDPANTRYEDSHCPESPIIDQIIEDLKIAFKKATGGLEISLIEKWAHIHEKNMSTNTHDHYPAAVSSAFYVSVPEGAGEICFAAPHNKYPDYGKEITFKPEEGMFLLFPGPLEHFVTRNLSEERRISLGFNFDIIRK